ncbi:MAG TPA: VIT1/CCC1 transporter family protein [Thermoleophilia bacterium]|nr:VIT1/CCC1 transporter family protein [Thermoleophilia bacterium]
MDSPSSPPPELSPERARELAEKRRTFDATKLFAEKERISGRSRIRQFMFGSLDGLLVPLGVVSGVAGGTSNSKIVVVAGVAEAFAGALSMGAGEYLSGKSETQVQAAAIRAEEEEIVAIPDIERLEIELLFEREGLSPDDARLVADKVTTSHRSWVNTMVEKELGLSAEPEGNALKDSLSMGAGEYLSGKSERQVQAAAIRDEEEEIVAIPDIERLEIELLFEREGLAPDDARLVADKVTTSHRSWVNTMVEKELGLSAEPEGNALKDSLSMGASYLLASLVPLGPYLFLSVRPAFVLSVVLTIVALFVIGLIKGRLAEMSLWRSVVEVVVIGLASAAGGYLLGTLVPHLIGS